MKLMNAKIKLTLGLALAGISSLHAQIVYVGSSTALGVNDSVGWSNLAPLFTVFGSGSPYSSSNGLAITVSSGTGGVLEVAQQGNGWAGNFSPGEFLLFNQQDGAISISFSHGIYGGGAQVSSDNYGSFAGTISAYGASDNLLGSFVFNGTSSGAGDGSAPFAGILSSTPDIYHLTFSAPNGGLADFSIGTLDLNAPVPEPTTMSFAVLLLPFGLRMLRTLRKPCTG
jgi:hypothetical protein